ncbi:MAG: ATP-binding protein [Crocinitomicaceae bacterium]|jgi:two-component system, OmpR family, phosphate regulon sensor histidine kinase PhoR|nr:ATP-binding protein [Crocinitomicaceae bacterium]
MKTARPSLLIFYGSLAFMLISFLFTLIVHFSMIELSKNLIIAIPIVSGIFAYLVFYFLLKGFIQYRLSLIYRSIQINQPENIAFSKSIDSLMEDAEKNVSEWKENSAIEISKLKEQAAFRKEFLGNLAHELKTPVFSIQGYLLTLLDGGLEDPNVNRAFLERASKSTDRITGILDDLDQITRMETENLRLEIRSFDIVELLKESFETFELIGKEKNFKLNFEKSFSAKYVQADRNKMGQVFTNLISNAISYGKENGELKVSILDIEDRYLLEFKDNGPGIEPHHLSRLFERFYRVEKSRNRNEGGSGLGLAIAKHIVESHGQSIQVKSEVGVGTTFVITIEKSKNSGPVSSRGIPLK